MKKFKVTSFSGIDSSGKSTYINLLESEMIKQGMKYKIVWSRGGYTGGMELLKKIMRFLLPGKLPPSGHSEARTEMMKTKGVSSLWYTLAVLDLIRLYAVTFRFLNMLGYSIICDRYIWDTHIDFYLMGYENKLGGILWRLLEKVHVKPDFSFCFIISPEESLRRSDAKKEPFSESLDARRKRIELYLSFVDQEKWRTTINTENKIIDDVYSMVSRAMH